MALASRYVNFAKLWKPQQAGTAFALTCLPRAAGGGRASAP